MEEKRRGGEERGGEGRGRGGEERGRGGEGRGGDKLTLRFVSRTISFN